MIKVTSTNDTLQDALIKKILENVSRHFLYHNVRQTDRRSHFFAWRVVDGLGKKVLQHVAVLNINNFVKLPGNILKSFHVSFHQILIHLFKILQRNVRECCTNILPSQCFIMKSRVDPHKKLCLKGVSNCCRFFCMQLQIR
jgi:hypothetical protein